MEQAVIDQYTNAANRLAAVNPDVQQQLLADIKFAVQAQGALEAFSQEVLDRLEILFNYMTNGGDEKIVAQEIQNVSVA